MADRLEGIEGKVAVITGARRTDRLEKLVAEIRAAGGAAGYRPLDVTGRDPVEGFDRFAVEKFGRLVTLVKSRLRDTSAEPGPATGRGAGPSE